MEPKKVEHENKLQGVQVRAWETLTWSEKQN